MTRTSVSYEDGLKKALKVPDEAAAYLNAALEDGSQDTLGVSGSATGPGGLPRRGLGKVSGGIMTVRFTCRESIIRHHRRRILAERKAAL